MMFDRARQMTSAIAAKVAVSVTGHEHLKLQAKDDDDEPIEDVDYMQPYGLSARPPEECSGILVELGGQYDNLAMINASPTDGSRPDCDVGEVIIWSIFGHRFALKKDNSLEIKTPAGATIVLRDDGSLTVAGGGSSSIAFSAAGAITVTPGTGQQLKLGGGGASFANAHVGSTLTAGAAISAWALLVESVCNTVVPGTFLPGTNFATTVAPAGSLGLVQTGSPNVQST